MNNYKIHLPRLLSILLGLIYIFSGASKGINIGSFVNLLLSYGYDWFGYFAPIITGFEIFVGFGLLFGAFRRELGKISFCFLFLLSLVYLAGYILKDIKDCGCFGEILQLSPTATLLKNTLMLFFSWVIWQQSPQNYQRKWLIFIAILFGLITTSINGFEFQGRVNSDIKLLGLHVKTSFLQPYLQNGEQIILVFNPLCQPCRETSIKLNNFKMPVTAICGNVFSEADFQDYKKAVQPNYPIYTAPIDSIQKHIFVYPTMLHVENGVVKTVLHSIE